MPIYTIYYDVRYANGCIEVEAESEEAAEAKFHEIRTEDLVAHCNNTEVDVESVFPRAAGTAGDVDSEDAPPR